MIFIVLELKKLRSHVIEVINVKTVEELLEVNLLSLELDEKLLRVRASLSTRPGLHVHLYLLPVLVV
jgi:hypothetical protein